VREEGIQNFAQEAKERNHLEDLGRDGRNILNWMKSVYWIHVMHDRDQWQVLVNTAMKIQVP
jgi:hypothetical protein